MWSPCDIGQLAHLICHVSSFNVKHWNLQIRHVWPHVQKVINRVGFTFLYMPIWSMEELVKCRSAMYPELLDDKLRSLFDCWGGFPHFVLQTLGDSHQHLLGFAIDSATVRTITDGVGAFCFSPAGSELIMHLHVEDHFITTYVRWASTWVAEEVSMRLFKIAHDQLRIFLSTSAVDADLEGIRGILWEGACHRLLAAGGTFKFRQLGTASMAINGTATEVTIESSPDRHIFDSWADVKTLPISIYAWPRVKNTLAVASAKQPHTSFQFAVSPSHVVDCEGLLDALSGMQADQGLVRLILVVPPEKFQTCTALEISHGPGAAAFRDHVNQYVLKVSL